MDIECVQGDITAQPDLDAIVNAANARLANGAFGYPMGEAAAVAMATVVSEGARLARVERVRFVLFDAASLAAHRRALEAVAGT